MPDKLFIAGKNGQVGRELVERALALGLEVVSFGSEGLDIRDRRLVLAAVAEHQPTVVINAAAYTAVDKAEDEKDLAYAVNRDGVENLALACKAQDIPLIHISTDYVFDGQKKTPYVESDTPNPIGVYGASKYAGEEVLRSTWHKHVIVRVSWVFGRYGNNFVKTMLRLAKERGELGVVDDQFGAPMSAVGIANAVLNCVLSEHDCFGLYHLESSPGVTWHGFAKEIFAQSVRLGLLDRSPVLSPILSDQFPTPVERPENSKLGTEHSDALGCLDWKRDIADMLSMIKE